MSKKIIILVLILFNLNIFLLAQSSFDLGVDTNLNDIGLSLNRTINKLNIKMAVGYPLYAILEEKNNFEQASAEDFFETICFHGTVNYNIINFKNLCLNLGLASDVFMQFDFSKEHTHYTCFAIGPIGELSYLLNKTKLALSLTFPFVVLENKPTNIIEPPQEKAWNELIDYNYALFYMVKIMFKFSISFPL